MASGPTAEFITSVSVDGSSASWSAGWNLIQDRSPREYGPQDEADDVRGEPAEHFVVLSGYHRERRAMLSSAPLLPNPVAAGHEYAVGVDRVVGSILLGILTYDANLLIIQPRHRRRLSRL